MRAPRRVVTALLLAMAIVRVSAVTCNVACIRMPVDHHAAHAAAPLPSEHCHTTQESDSAVTSSSITPAPSDTCAHGAASLPTTLTKSAVRATSYTANIATFTLATVAASIMRSSSLRQHDPPGTHSAIVVALRI
jgi:hypothetical protein